MIDTPNETQVFIAIKDFLIENDWRLLGGQPPSGTDHLPVIEIRDPLFKGKGSKGSFKPDLIAWKDRLLMVLELKPSYSQSDRRKINLVLQSPDRINSLWESLIERNIDLGPEGMVAVARHGSKVVGGLGYGGEPVSHPELWRFHLNNRKVTVTPGSFAIESI